MVKVATTTTKIVFKGAGKRHGLTFDNPKVLAMEPESQQHGPEEHAQEIINGEQAQSHWEWNTARALWTLGRDFEYQVPIDGGREVMGGQVLDFLVDTPPTRTPVMVNGDYWHSSKDSTIENTMVEDALRRWGYMVSPSVVLTDAEASTYEDALRFLTAKIGR